MLLLIPFAYGEKIEIDIPFESHGYNCTLYDTVDNLTFECIFEGKIQTFTLEDLKKFESVLTEEQIDKAIQDIEQKEIKKIEDSKITENDKLLIKLKQKYAKQSINNEDLVLLFMIKELDLCYQGLGRSAVAQDYREFDISKYEDYKNNHVSIEGKLGEIAKNMEECRAQQVLENKVFSEKYNNLAVGKNDITFSLLEHYKGVQAIPYDKINSNNHNIDMRVICDSNQHSQPYKNLMNCPKPIYDGDSSPKNNGFITYYSKSLESYGEFMVEYGNKKATFDDKQIEADKAEIIKEKILQENFWYYR